MVVSTHGFLVQIRDYLTNPLLIVFDIPMMLGPAFQVPKTVAGIHAVVVQRSYLDAAGVA